MPRGYNIPGRWRSYLRHQHTGTNRKKWPMIESYRGIFGCLLQPTPGSVCVCNRRSLGVWPGSGSPSPARPPGEPPNTLTFSATPGSKGGEGGVPKSARHRLYRLHHLFSEPPRKMSVAVVVALAYLLLSCPRKSCEHFFVDRLDKERMKCIICRRYGRNHAVSGRPIPADISLDR
jgi:hypothetical protein